jgi:hypothetical protein
MRAWKLTEVETPTATDWKPTVPLTARTDLTVSRAAEAVMASF